MYRAQYIIVLKKVSLVGLLIFVLIFVWTYLFIHKSELRKKDSVPPYIRIPVQNKVCYVNHIDRRLHMAYKTHLKTIYYITPTYPRPEQVPELTRLSHTLMHVPKIHWIVADDHSLCAGKVLDILERSGLPFTHISSPKPFIYRVPKYPRGVANRRAALSWIHENVQDGIVYFGDDDNTVDLRLFDEIRQTKKVSMFPVGLIKRYGISSPVVKDGRVVGFFDSWPGKRKFAVDMAGFAINIKFLNTSAKMPYMVGYEEDRFLQRLRLKMEDIEPLADNCSRVLVWHTKAAHHTAPTLRLDVKKLREKYASFARLLEETAELGMARFDPKNGTKTKITYNRKTHETLTGLGLV